MSSLVTADLHLTDNPRDEYRWGIFPWLAKTAKSYGIKEILLLGDLTDAKDRHSAVLTNRMTNGIGMLTDICDVIVLRGNHDYINEAEPFFGFIDAFNGKHVCTFITEPAAVVLSIGRCLLLPNTRNYEEAWKGLDLIDQDYIFTHQTYDGCLTENGTELPGIPPSVLAKTQAKVFSGDIHVPQKISKNIEYVGAPYRCRFGDSYDARILMIGRTKDGKHQQQDLKFKTITKHLVEIKSRPSIRTQMASQDEIYAGDQVKVRVRLPRSLYPEWPAMRAEIIEYAAKLEWELTGPELIAEPEAPTTGAKAKSAPVGGYLPKEALGAYADQKELEPALRKAGMDFLKRATGTKA